MSEQPTTAAVTAPDREGIDSDAEITLGLLTAVHENSTHTQRTMAKELGIALGLANAYLKRCVEKGFIKVSQVPANRYAYYLTPKGFMEKSRLTASYLKHSFDFFRRARQHCEEALAHCDAQGWRRVGIYGAGELCEILILCAHEFDAELVGVVVPDGTQQAVRGLPVHSTIQGLGPVDAVVLADLTEPQSSFEAIASEIDAERVLTPSLLRVSRSANLSEAESGPEVAP